MGNYVQYAVRTRTSEEVNDAISILEGMGYRINSWVKANAASIGAVYTYEDGSASYLSQWADGDGSTSDKYYNKDVSVTDRVNYKNVTLKELSRIANPYAETLKPVWKTEAEWLTERQEYIEKFIADSMVADSKFEIPNDVATEYVSNALYLKGVRFGS